MTAVVVDSGDDLPLTVPALIEARAAARRDHPLLICDEQVLTYADAASRSTALAKGLLAVGAGRGSHVGVLQANGAELVVCWLAAARIGAVTIPISTLSTSAELATLLRNADVELLLATTSYRGRDHVDALRHAVPDLDVTVPPPLHVLSTPALRRVAFDAAVPGVAPEWTGDALVALGAEVDDEVLDAAGAAVAPSDRMVIVHTSGSTGEPKAVIHQHGALIRHVDNLNELRRHREDDVLFSHSPFFWIHGFAYELLATMLAGATLVCANASDPSATLDVRPSDPELRHDVFGMTEAGSVCLASAEESEQPEHRRGSFGRPVPGFEAKVVDPETDAACETGEVGELWLRGPFLMEGYYGRERHETFTLDGWYRTGDLFHVDRDGCFSFAGRRGDMIVAAVPRVPPPDEATLPTLLHRNAHQHAAKPVLVTADRSITHRELDDESRLLAARLVAAGIGKCARVGLVAPNGIDWAVTSAAVMRLGAVLVPLSTLLRAPELEAQLRVAAVTHLVVEPTFRGRDYLDELEAAVPGLMSTVDAGRRHPRLPFLRHVWQLGRLPQAAVDDALVTALEAVVRPADDLAILFTSGSRGVPKGTVHTHGGALHAVASSLEARCVGVDDRLYIPMPFFWTGGFSSGLLSTLVAGATLVTEAVPDPPQTIELLARERVTLFRGWPDQAARLASDPSFASADLSCLGPGSLPAVLPADRRPATGARPNLFGMTETCGPYAGGRLDLDLPAAAIGSCGRTFDGVEVRIVDPDTGVACAQDVVGEIRVRGRNVMRGICGRTRDRTFDADGFYPTGDLGAVDGSGHLWFHGRSDDMFKVRGATVYPSEVEAAIRALDGVRHAHVTDIATGDGAREVGALVVASATIEQLIAGVRARLSAFKVPTRWIVTTSADDVPMSATAKVDKSALQELLRRDGRRAGPARDRQRGSVGG